MTLLNANDAKYEEWKQLNSKYLHEIKKILHNTNQINSLKIISYFTYSFNINENDNLGNFCIGTFHIQNVGTIPLNSPYICILIDSKDEFEFSGKYFYNDSLQKNRMPKAWERINDLNEKFEYWLRPNDIEILAAGTTISFPNFQLKWKPKSSYAFRVNGFIYGEQLKEGQNSLNNIHIKKTNKEES